MDTIEAVAARFAPGARVRVRRADPPGHVRTPWYCRGRAGVIERI
jgi:nitrile hydratase